MLSNFSTNASFLNACNDCDPKTAITASRFATDREIIVGLRSIPLLRFGEFVSGLFSENELVFDRMVKHIFQIACENGIVEVAIECLSAIADGRSSFNPHFDSETPFRSACSNGRFKLVKALLSSETFLKGFDPFAFEHDSVASALTNGELETFRLVFESCYSKNQKASENGVRMLIEAFAISNRKEAFEALAFALEADLFDKLSLESAISLTNDAEMVEIISSVASKIKLKNRISHDLNAVKPSSHISKI